MRIITIAAVAVFNPATCAYDLYEPETPIPENATSWEFDGSSTYTVYLADE